MAMDLSKLSSNLPPSVPVTKESFDKLDAKLINEFKNAAKSVATLYRLSNSNSSLLRFKGYLECIDDLLNLIKLHKINHSENELDIENWCLTKKAELMGGENINKNLVDDYSEKTKYKTPKKKSGSHQTKSTKLSDDYEFTYKAKPLTPIENKIKMFHDSAKKKVKIFDYDKINEPNNKSASTIDKSDKIESIDNMNTMDHDISSTGNNAANHNITSNSNFNGSNMHNTFNHSTFTDNDANNDRFLLKKHFKVKKNYQQYLDQNHTNDAVDTMLNDQCSRNSENDDSSDSSSNDAVRYVARNSAGTKRSLNRDFRTEKRSRHY
ncbi:uncharacterized protein ASCRUDRAFT_74667 [Ascoidea rubescens DSM 1968]|uniref:Uncharacterized protein n=1 Tax=Ascoidea rubescens DSM 1968 TaxID=1344418 RepID=A0A1D2VKW1_9ASCO|nr:hypothetical protein ASCRUDRAFT_74667 [Ascoidea rubescens DSM 1968]ODV62242.1 hypothetical protein ASCRUDRAFT_74667 [Ascoidea rubescens DSM 1968]